MGFRVYQDFGQVAAEKVLRNFEDAEKMLSRFHYLGMVIEGNPRYRKTFVGGKNTVVYRVDERKTGTIVIIVAVHSAGQSIDWSMITEGIL